MVTRKKSLSWGGENLKIIILKLHRISLDSERERNQSGTTTRKTQI